MCSTAGQKLLATICGISICKRASLFHGIYQPHDNGNRTSSRSRCTPLASRDTQIRHKYHLKTISNETPLSDTVTSSAPSVDFRIERQGIESPRLGVSSLLPSSRIQRVTTAGSFQKLTFLKVCIGETYRPAPLSPSSATGTHSKPHSSIPAPLPASSSILAAARLACTPVTATPFDSASRTTRRPLSAGRTCAISGDGLVVAAVPPMVVNKREDGEWPQRP